MHSLHRSEGVIEQVACALWHSGSARRKLLCSESISAGRSKFLGRGLVRRRYPLLCAGEGITARSAPAPSIRAKRRTKLAAANSGPNLDRSRTVCWVEISHGEGKLAAANFGSPFRLDCLSSEGHGDWPDKGKQRLTLILLLESSNRA